MKQAEGGDAAAKEQKTSAEAEDLVKKGLEEKEKEIIDLKVRCHCEGGVWQMDVC